MPLRNFLFLNTKALNDYLATLEGGLIEGTVDQTEVGKRDRGGKISAKVVEGNMSSTTSLETKTKAAVNDAAKFQRLYKLLEDSDDSSDQLQVLEAFDEGIWDQLHRSEVLEVIGTARLPRAFSMLSAVQDINPMLNIMSLMGQDPLADPEIRVAFDGIRALGDAIEQKPVPLVLEAAGGPGFTFVANLPRQYMLSEVSELQGEVTLFGTIQRFIPRGQSYQAFSLLPNFPGMDPVAQQKTFADLVEKGHAEEVEGPAAIITPLAVYR
jgi:hypothetical protein